jgi:hypothetical protein
VDAGIGTASVSDGFALAFLSSGVSN